MFLGLAELLIVEDIICKYIKSHGETLFVKIFDNLNHFKSHFKSLYKSIIFMAFFKGLYKFNSFKSFKFIF